MRVTSFSDRRKQAAPARAGEGNGTRPRNAHRLSPQSRPIIEMSTSQEPTLQCGCLGASRETKLVIVAKKQAKNLERILRRVGWGRIAGNLQARREAASTKKKESGGNRG